MPITGKKDERTPSRKDRVTATYAAEGNTLALRSLHANVTINSGVGIKSVRATVTGNASAMKALKVDTTNGLEITGKSIGLTGKTIILTALWLIAAVFVGFAKAKARIEHLLRGDPYKLTITVPKGTNIFAREFRGKITGEGQFGDFDGVVYYGSTVTFESLTRLHLDASIDCTVTVYALKGNCWATLGTNCELEIQTGEIRYCELKLGTDCKANIAGSCVSSDVKTGESCEVSFGACTESLDFGLGSSSELVVTGGRLGKLYGSTEVNSIVIADGVTGLVAVNLGIGSSLILGEVTDMLKADCQTGSNITTKNGTIIKCVDISLDMGGNLTLVGVIGAGQITAAGGTAIKVGAFRPTVVTRFEYDTKVTEGHFKRGI